MSQASIDFYRADQPVQVLSMVVRDSGGRQRTIKIDKDEVQAEAVYDPASAMRVLLAEHSAELYSNKEHFIVMTLNTRRQLINSRIISVGTLDSALVHPREVFIECVKDSASALLIAHNHPSGDPTPSNEDLALTKRLEKCARLLGFTLLDHLIVGKRGVVSLREKGQLFADTALRDHSF